jgi:hypothetical protein
MGSHTVQPYGDYPRIAFCVIFYNNVLMARRWSSTAETCKAEAVQLQAWSGPEVSRKLSFPDFMTTALEGGKVVSLRHRPHLPPGNPPGTHFC